MSFEPLAKLHLEPLAKLYLEPLAKLQLEPLAKFLGECKKRQGTTSVVPLAQQQYAGLQPLRLFAFQLFAVQRRLKPESKFGLPHD